MSSNEQGVSDEEKFHNIFFYFVKAVRMMAMDATSQRQEMASKNLAWEIQHDVLELGEGVLNSPSTCLSRDEQEAVKSLLIETRNVSPDAVQGEANAILHADWAHLRAEAAKVLGAIGRAIKDNELYFHH